MVFAKFSSVIFLALISAQTALGVDHIYSEVLLKKLNQRIGKVLSESLEAQVFIEEDLSLAMKTLESAKIKWENTLSELPYLFSDAGKKTIFLSRYYSFNTTKEEQVSLVTEILFNLKRQLEGSTLSIPQARIRIFAQKFSSLLLGETDSCSLSLSPLPTLLTRSQRDKFTPELISLLEARDYTYESTWAENIVWIEAKETTDGGCGGNNRNKIELTFSLVNLRQQKSETISKATGTSCGYSDQHKNEALNKLMKKIRSQLPKCNHALETF
jgi:hypothetical protein